MMLAVAFCCWEPWFSSKTAAQSCCWFVAADEESWLARKTRLGKDACSCLLLLGTPVSQENFCRLLLLVGSCWGESWLARKTRLANNACSCLMLPGNLVSQENFCRLLLLVSSCWWGILVGQEKLAGERRLSLLAAAENPG